MVCPLHAQERESDQSRDQQERESDQSRDQEEQREKEEQYIITRGEKERVVGSGDSCNGPSDNRRGTSPGLVLQK